MDLHSGEEIVFEGHPSWRATLGFYLLGLLGAAVLGALAGVIFEPATGGLVWLVLFAAVLAVGFLRRLATTYVVTSQRLYIRRGLLSRNVQQTRIDRVQNVNTYQSLLERMLRVGTADFDTAGTDDSDFAFRGIADPHAIVAAVDRVQRGQRTL
ncbi:MAG: PH domain-containing protein [Actinomycetota bacterium]|nr:PH domain-containing protein [Actinomycetota bacterium]